ncbi:MAG: protease inhibitor I42 family protein, partial [Actinobacteria bacterium]|nr:protease inhibitor I42 family protein [Actinomycetota bacterium]
LSKEPLLVTADDDGDMVYGKVGDFFMVELDENLTTGYSWTYTGISRGKPDERVVVQSSTHYKEPGAEQAEVGVGGLRQTTYEAVGPGETTLRLVYVRPFDLSNPAKTFSVVFKVEG